MKIIVPREQAALAKPRDYDEPFEILGAGVYRLVVALGDGWNEAVLAVLAA